MGYDASAITAIGIEVNENHLMVTREVRIKDGPEGARFDPESGKPLFRVESEPLPGYEPGDCFMVGDKRFKIHSVGCEDDRAIICVWSQTASGYGKQLQSVFLSEAPFEDHLADKALLKRALGDLWVEKDWGLFTILYESY